MRITGPSGAPAAQAGSAARRATGHGFTLGEAGQTRAPAESAGPRQVGGIDALMALQGIEDATERKRRAVKRGRNALDALDALKLALLDGRLDGLALARLHSAAEGLGESSGDPRIDSVLAEIELRVGVELAKIGMPRGA